MTHRVATPCLLTCKQEEFYGKQVILADRTMVEQESDAMLDGADAVNVAFLVVGDPFRYVSFSFSSL